MAAFCAWSLVQATVLTPPARSRLRALLQLESATGLFQVWHRLQARMRASSAMSRLVPPPLPRAFATAPLMGCSARLPRKASSASRECRLETAEADLSFPATACPVEAAVVPPLIRARSAARLLPATIGSEAWRPSVRPKVAAPARARPQGRAAQRRRQELLVPMRLQALPRVPAAAMRRQAGPQ